MSEGVFAIIGGGPAGLAAAYFLTKNGLSFPVVLEQDGQIGGLAKTLEHRGFRCDIGGHRFFTRSREVESLWREVLPRDFVRRPRLSRIYYGGKFYYYPIRVGNALHGLGVQEGIRLMGSFARAKLFPRRPEVSFEDWVSNRFGHRLYSIFFRAYTEKVWGIPCTVLSADWAAQRIRDLDLTTAILDSFGIGRGRKVASLIDEFDYPLRGPGQMYEAMGSRVVERGGCLRLRHDVRAIRHDGKKVVGLEVRTPDGLLDMDADQVISTMPLSQLVLRMLPEPPDRVVSAARGLSYRSIITVNLLIQRDQVAPDTWVYLHAPEVAAGRLQIYKNWSPAMVPGPGWNSLGLEYFATEGDPLWSNSDADMLEIGKKEIGRLGFATPAEIAGGFVVRYPMAYPVYDEGYVEKVALIRSYLSQFGNLECAGRYGQFRYNNMDHSIMTGILAARKLCGEDVDPWAVNAEAQYLEQS